MIEADAVATLADAPVAVPTPSQSGKGQTFFRCPQCQVALWSHYAGAGSAIRFVRVGTLDLPDALSPDIHIFTDSKQPWVILPDDVPAVPEFYRRSEYWPQESIDRRKAVLG